MTLLELCEPLFQYVCRLNRMARKGGRAEVNLVRAELKGLLADAKSRASADPVLAMQWDKVELPLIFFIDSMIRESKLPFASRWDDLARERNELAGDEKFFDLLDETLSERGEAAQERLRVYYTCLGLGFRGWYAGQPEYLRKKMLEINARLRGLTGESPRICPEAYTSDDSNLIEPPSRTLAPIVIALVVLVATLLAANAWLYSRGTTSVAEAIGQIERTAKPVAKEGGR